MRRPMYRMWLTVIARTTSYKHSVALSRGMNPINLTVASVKLAISSCRELNGRTHRLARLISQQVP